MSIFYGWLTITRTPDSLAVRSFLIIFVYYYVYNTLSHLIKKVNIINYSIKKNVESV